MSGNSNSGKQEVTEKKADEEFTLSSEDRLSWQLVIEREAHAKTRLDAAQTERKAFEQYLSNRYGDNGRYEFVKEKPVDINTGRGFRRPTPLLTSLKVAS